GAPQAISTLFPYTTLFRSDDGDDGGRGHDRGDGAHPGGARHATARRGQPQPPARGVGARPERRRLCRALAPDRLAMSAATKETLPRLRADFLIGGRWVEAV